MDSPPDGNSPTLSRSSSTSSISSLISNESHSGEISSYGLQRALHKLASDPVTKKDSMYFGGLSHRSYVLNQELRAAQEALEQAWAERLAAETTIDGDLLKKLDMKLAETGKARGIAERAAETHKRSIDFLRSLPVIDRRGIKIIMDNFHAVAINSSQHAERVVEIPQVLVTQLFQKVLNVQAELNEKSYHYITLATMRRMDHFNHQDEFEKLVEAHFQLDDARGEISALRDEVDHINRLHDSLMHVYDAQDDEDQHRQSMNLYAMLGRTRGELKHVRGQNVQLKKALRATTERMAALSTAEKEIGNLKAESSLFSEEIQSLREAAKMTKNKTDASENANAEQQAEEESEQTGVDEEEHGGVDIGVDPNA